MHQPNGYPDQKADRNQAAGYGNPDTTGPDGDNACGNAYSARGNGHPAGADATRSYPACGNANPAWGYSASGNGHPDQASPNDAARRWCAGHPCKSRWATYVRNVPFHGTWRGA